MDQAQFDLLLRTVNDLQASVQTGTVIKIDQVQIEGLLEALKSHAPSFSTGNVVAVFAAVIALAALANSYLVYRRQRAIDRQRYTADLHESWWSDDFDTKRHIVWQELEKWEKCRDQSPAIRYYSNAEGGWPIESPERKAHARVLFFFSDLNTLLDINLIDEEMAFRMFGIVQYDHFRDYFCAIRNAVKQRQPITEKLPRWVEETEHFQRRLDAWKTRRS